MNQPFSIFQNTDTPSGTLPIRLPIYEDKDMYKPWSLDGSVFTQQSVAKYGVAKSGETSIYTKVAAWGNICLKNGNWGLTTEYSASQFNKVEFSIYPNNNANFYIYLTDITGSVVSTVSTSSLFLTTKNVWNNISISMSALNPSGSPYDTIGIQEQDGIVQTFYIDNVYLSRV